MIDNHKSKAKDFEKIKWANEVKMSGIIPMKLFHITIINNLIIISVVHFVDAQLNIFIAFLDQFVNYCFKCFFFKN